MNKEDKEQYNLILEELSDIALSINKVGETIKLLIIEFKLSDYLVRVCSAAADREVERLFHVLKPFYKIMEYGDLPPLSFSVFTDMALTYFKASLTAHEFRFFAAVDAMNQKNLYNSFTIFGVNECIACEDEKICLEYLGARHLNESLKLKGRPIKVAKVVRINSLDEELLYQNHPRPIWVFIEDIRYFDDLNRRLINLKKTKFIRRKKAPVSQIDMVEGITHYRMTVYLAAATKFGFDRVISEKGKIGILLKNNTVKRIDNEEDVNAMDPTL